MNSPGNKGFRNLSSDIPLIKKQRAPATMEKSESDKPKIEHIDNLSGYVEKNLKNAVKPRSKEYR